MFICSAFYAYILHLEKRVMRQKFVVH